jgi:hypothetical protein
MAYVYPNCQSVVRWEGGRIHLNPGQQWNSDDPFVLARPEFFDADPAAVSTTAEREPVERGTRAPGETRTPPRRPAASKAKPKTGETTE